MQVGDIVWFDPSKPNVWGAFSYVDLNALKPFKVRVGGIMEDGALDVTPVPHRGGAPETLFGCFQLVQVSQLSEDYPDNSGADEPTADILWLIEQLEWLSVEQKKISMKELLSLFKESANV